MITGKYLTRALSSLFLISGVTLSGAVATAEVIVKTELGAKTPVNISKNVSISADELEANLRKDIVIFVGNVVISQEDLTMNSDRVTVFYQKSDKSESAITRIDASGSVKLTTKTETIRSTWGIYDFAEKIVTLGGKVTLKRPDGEIKGKRLVYNLKSGMITIENDPKNKGRVTGQFKLPKKLK